MSGNSSKVYKNPNLTLQQNWNIIDVRFFSIWFVISNIPGFLEQHKYVEGLYKGGLYNSIIATIILLILIPVILLVIAENTIIKRFFIKLFSKLNWLYHAVGWICFGIMLFYLVLFTLNKLGIHPPL